PFIYPNPAKGVEAVTLHLAPCDTDEDVRLKVFTTAFRKVLDSTIPAGTTAGNYPLELKDNWGIPLANGLYYLVINRGEGVVVKKMIVLR
ncbi:MAG TPA: T9SS type A sorting domain-containing protein, partial [bacterium]|nr:T9SS type A sorting domain-containing protein [bacterium]